jgi:hypothetical protein
MTALAVRGVVQWERIGNRVGMRDEGWGRQYSTIVE